MMKKSKKKKKMRTTESLVLEFISYIQGVANEDHHDLCLGDHLQKWSGKRNLRGAGRNLKVMYDYMTPREAIALLTENLPDAKYLRFWQFMRYVLRVDFLYWNTNEDTYYLDNDEVLNDPDRYVS